MHLSVLLTNELYALSGRIGRNELDILETGSIRGTEERYHQNDGWSTLTFAKHVDTYGGSLTSIDLDILAAEQVLSRHDLLHCTDLVQGYSVDVLADLLISPERQQSFDVILLDSDNDGLLILHEYMLARRLLKEGGLILVDDVDPRSTEVVKGEKLVPWLDAAGTPYRLETRTGDGYSTGVLVMEF